MDVFIQDRSGTEAFHLCSQMGRKTNLLTLVQRLIMKTLISKR